ncbi:CRP-like cAMP-binding protein [Devosia sp. UYZn731]|uniref:Crp/Fnr family transcriptional regulator n=1 Tax=Devosia sp. UYZn731 TaxID=3156345 RepID=UPI003393349B
MSDLLNLQTENRLLAALPISDLHAIAQVLEPAVLGLKTPIEMPGRVVDHVYFVESGLVSVVASEHGKRIADVGMIGYEGATGSALALGDDLPSLETIVQIPGRGWRMTANEFRNCLHKYPSFKELMLRYARVLWIQASCTALIQGSRRVEARLARWLLMVQDRMRSDEIRVTHELLAAMLHCRRPSVTVALHFLEGEHLIVSRRSMLLILDRERLKKFAEGAYGTPEAEYERLIGSVGKAITAREPLPVSDGDEAAALHRPASLPVHPLLKKG